MKASKINKWKWQSISLILIMCFISSSSKATAIEQPVDLIQITIEGSQKLEVLAGLEIPILEHLTTADGLDVVFLPADPFQKERLIENSFNIQIIAAYDPQSESQPFLLYGTPKDLELAGQETPILWKDGRFALTITTPQQADQISMLGIQRQQLSLKEVFIPETEASAAFALAFPGMVTPSSQVYSMISQVNQGNLYNSIGDFSGEWPVLINNKPYTLQTRYTYAYQPITKATRLAWEKFDAMGLGPQYHYYNFLGMERRNVLAEQTGLTQPERIFMLVAHLDSYSPSANTLAPGADDNATGSVALLTIANILRNYQFGCTLRYALFTGEEQGYLGSIPYANRPDLGNIQAVLNLDMLGYNTPNTAATIELHTRNGNSGDLAIAYLFRDVINAYQIPLIPQIIQDGLSFSDHSSFWKRGYPALLAIEDWDDHTPYYHSVNDRLKNLNMPYYTNFTRAALATFAHMGCLIEATPEELSSYYLPLVSNE